MNDPATDHLSEAANQLAKSTTGYVALNALLNWLEEYGLNLDGQNKVAVMILLDGAFGAYTGTTLDVISNAVGRRD